MSNFLDPAEQVRAAEAGSDWIVSKASARIASLVEQLEQARAAHDASTIDHEQLFHQLEARFIELKTRRDDKRMLRQQLCDRRMQKLSSLNARLASQQSVLNDSRKALTVRMRNLPCARLSWLSMPSSSLSSQKSWTAQSGILCP